MRAEQVREWGCGGGRKIDALFPEEPVVPLSKPAKVTSGDPGSRGAKDLNRVSESTPCPLENCTLPSRLDAEEGSRAGREDAGLPRTPSSTAPGARRSKHHSSPVIRSKNNRDIVS